ncbi:MAG TPA: ribosome-associated translation inhibitor RaiA [Acidimicrobiales bacterium]|nr:ribosome-associated translation inhibitor RaiA [Acidimicrobiales bacterium]
MLEVAMACRHAEVPADVKLAAESKLVKLERFLEGMERALVRFSEEQNPRIHDREVCEVTMEGHGHVVRARASGPDMLTAVDRVVDKLELRLVRLKGRLVGRSHPRRQAPVD